MLKERDIKTIHPQTILILFLQEGWIFPREKFIGGFIRIADQKLFVIAGKGRHLIDFTGHLFVLAATVIFAARPEGAAAADSRFFPALLDYIGFSGIGYTGENVAHSEDRIANELQAGINSAVRCNRHLLLPETAILVLVGFAHDSRFDFGVKGGK